MTKTLTEQWRDRELNEGWYYVVREWDDEIRMLYFEGDYFLDTDVPLDDDNIKEVIASVPSYNEVKEMSQKIERLEFDNEALEISRDELEKKLNKAEEAIKEAYWKCENCYKGVCQYCLNSGVRCYMQGNKVESVGKLKEKLDIAVKALEWYDGLENLLIGWEIFTGQPKGTAKKAIEKIKEVK